MTDDLLALVSDDLADSVAQCVAAAGYRLIRGEVSTCGRAWRSTRGVIVDPTSVLALTDVSLPVRRDVVLVAQSAAPAGVWRAGVSIGVDAAFELPGDEQALVRHLSERRVRRDSSGAAIAIVGGHGGAGASVLACATALVAADDHRVLLVDGDDVGAGIDLTLGIEDALGLRWQDLTAATGRVSATALHDTLPSAASGVSVLTRLRDDPRPVVPSALTAVIEAGRSAGDLVIVDTARTDNEVTRASIAAVDVVVVVTTATVAGVAGVRTVARRLLDGVPTVEVAVRGPAFGGLRAADIADAVGLPLVTAYRPDPRLPTRLETTPLGRLMRKPLQSAAGDVLTRIRSGAWVA